MPVPHRSLEWAQSVLLACKTSVSVVVKTRAISETAKPGRAYLTLFCSRSESGCWFVSPCGTLAECGGFAGLG
jgi:hypothetical protein